MSSRRNFLKLAGASAGALAAAKLGIKPAVAQGDIPWGDFVRLSQLSWNDLYGNPPALGRVGQGVVCVNFDGSPAAGLKVFRGPSTSSGIVRKVCAHYVAPIYAAVRGEPYDARSWSDVWYYIGPNEDGQDEYLHSAFVIPTREVLNQPEEVTDWFWGEVTVPIAYQFKSPSFNAWYDFDYYKVFYGQVHQILESATDDAGNVWYRIYDDIEPDRPAWVLAQTFRRITPAEFEPINPQVQDKVIEIDLGRQTITCLEEGYPVFRTRIASGTVYNAPDGTPIDFSTPYGDNDIQGKRPSRRMRGGEENNQA
ncbi:MAG: twin-arginine translocation signal domain-containing protein [Anaerolineae bacterium]